MSLTITLARSADGQATASDGTTLLGRFDPAALRRTEPPPDPAAYGQQLWQALGGDQLAAALAPLPYAPDPAALIVLHTDDAELHAIPWEYLCTPDGSWLIHDYLVIRSVPVPPTAMPAPPPSAAAWRLVAQASNPLIHEEHVFGGQTTRTFLSRLQVAAEIDALGRSLERHQPPPPLRWQRIGPTRTALTNLATSEPLIFHYTGHGDVLDGEPVLCYDDGTGRMQPTPVRDMAKRLRGRAYLAFLNACRTADSKEPGANLALQLVRGGVPIVLGTQYSVLDKHAAPFAWTFYQHLTAGATPALALYFARLSLRDQAQLSPSNWGLPVLYSAAGYVWPGLPPSGERPAPVPAPPLAVDALHAPTILVGRAVELVDLAQLYVLENARIVTIRGSGGMGKTALAGALARRLRFHFTDGIYALTLALPSTARLSAAEVRRQLAVLLGLDQLPIFKENATADQQEVVLLQATRDRQLLLIFDNYETVLWALGRERTDEHPAHADYEQAQEIHRLVTRLGQADVSLLFTTRESPLNLAYERLYPKGEDQHHEQLRGLDPRSAAELFRHHAGQQHAYSASFPTQVAAKVGHQPLSILLAASRWATSHTDESTFLTQITNQLLVAQKEGVLDHQRSLLANLQLSLNTLTPEQQRHFLALTLIGSPLIRPIHGAVLWGLEDEQQWFADQAHVQLELFERRSLLQGLSFDDEHNWWHAYTLQPAIAQVARHLATSLDLTTERERYAAWVDVLVDRAFGKGGIKYSPEVAQQTIAALDDISTAVPWLPPDERGWTAWRAAYVFRMLGRPAESASLLSLAETTAEEQENLELHSRVKLEQAKQAQHVGDMVHAQKLYEECLMLNDQLGEVKERSATLHALANLFTRRGDLARAQALYEECLQIDEQFDDSRGRSATLHALAHIYVVRGELAQAQAIYEECLIIQDQIGDIQGRAVILHGMAYLYRVRGDLERAQALYEESLKIKAQLGDIYGRSATLYDLANLYQVRGDVSQAQALYEESLKIQDHLGDIQGRSATLHSLANLCVDRGELARAQQLYEESLAIKAQLGDIQGRAATLVMLAQLLVQQGQREHALAHGREALAIFERLGATREIAQTQKILEQIEQFDGQTSPSQLTPARVVGGLTLQTTRVMKGGGDRRQLQDALGALASIDDVHRRLAQALEAAVAQNPGAAAAVLEAATPLLERDSSWSVRADALVGCANIAHLLDDVATERASTQASVAAWQQAGDDVGTRGRLRDMLHRLAALEVRRGDFAAAEAALVQVVALGEQLAHPNLERNREELDFVRQQRSGGGGPQLTPARLVGRLVLQTTRALKGEGDHSQLQGLLDELPAIDAVHRRLAEALTAALARESGAAAAVLAAALPLLERDENWYARADALVGCANIADLLDDPATELASIRASAAAWQQAGSESKVLERLRSTLHRLGFLELQGGDMAAAEAALVQVVSLSEQLGHKDLDENRQELAFVRQMRAPVADLIAAWLGGRREEEGLAQLLNQLLPRVVVVIRTGTEAQREQLAGDLAALRAAAPLPIEGTNGLLHVLQCWLRDLPPPPGKREQLPEGMRRALEAMERDIAGLPPPEADEPEPEPEAEQSDAKAQLEQALAMLPPEQRQAMQVAFQIIPLFKEAHAVLRHRDATQADRVQLAGRVEQASFQAADGEQPGSPWLDAAEALRQLAALLRGYRPRIEHLPPIYQQLFHPLIGGAPEQTDM